MPETGNFLGQMTCELSKFGVGSYIKSLVVADPKFYSAVVKKPDNSEVEITKVKGVTLNYSTHNLINYISIKKLVTGEQTNPIKINFPSIQRTELHQVITSNNTKIVRVVLLKRRRKGYDSFPYGYVENK